MINLGKQVSKLIGWFHGNLALFSSVGISLGMSILQNATFRKKIDMGENAAANMLSKVVLQF